MSKWPWLGLVIGSSLLLIYVAFLQKNPDKKAHDFSHGMNYRIGFSI